MRSLMGKSGSSSKKKYSKKKSLKVSSEARRKKTSRRNKSKKLSRHDDSYSSYSDDDSTSSSLVSSSSSEGKYKSRKSRSRTRNEVKGSKKRSRRRSYSEDSSNDSLPVKKRRRSKKKSASDKKNKKKIKKKSRRDGYISDSASCSTCGDEDSSSDEDTNTIKGKNGNRKNRNRQMRSSSPYEDDDDDNIENVTMENNPRRLKSVITIVASQPENEEGDDMKRYDEVKEEMVYDYDHDYDYPSCKSNDSNDGEPKKELVDNNNISVMSKEKDNLESGVDDLESILRQKALENLSRFRGGIQTKTVVDPVIDNKEKNVVENPVSQPVIQRSRFTWRRDEHEKTDTTYSGPDSSGSQPKLQSADLSSTERVENIINTHENVEVKKSTDGVETPSSASGSNEASQFEKKTMSVMRGGEMVQVSYKVYIPNRAPALARRQLKR